MLTFEQWIKENGMRTSLGIYPPGYGSALYPPLYFTPISATAPLMLTTVHKDEHPELLKKKKKSKKKKKKAKKED
jgi:hypothetical protein